MLLLQLRRERRASAAGDRPILPREMLLLQVGRGRPAHAARECPLLAHRVLPKRREHLRLAQRHRAAVALRNAAPANEGRGEGKPDAEH
jgi:hypothetical protein